MSLKKTCFPHCFLIDCNSLVHYHLSLANKFSSWLSEFLSEGQKKKQVSSSRVLVPSASLSPLLGLHSSLQSSRGTKTGTNNRKPIGNILHVHLGLHLNTLFLWHVNSRELGIKSGAQEEKYFSDAMRPKLALQLPFSFPKSWILASATSFTKKPFFFPNTARVVLSNGDADKKCSSVILPLLSRGLSFRSGLENRTQKKKGKNKSSHKTQDGQLRESQPNTAGGVDLGLGSRKTSRVLAAHVRAVPSMTQRPFVFSHARHILYGKVMIFHLRSVKTNVLRSIHMTDFAWASITNKQT